MEPKDDNGNLPQAEPTSPNYPKPLGDSQKQKQILRTQAINTFPSLGVCVLCGDSAVNRHSKAGHAFPVSAEDTVPTCMRCHHIIHHGDKKDRRLSSWAWRNPA